MKYTFRGFDIIGHKWVYGDLVHNKKVTETGLEDRTMVGGYEVDPDSVGLCLWKKDVSGRVLYEGDIVRTVIKDDMEVTATVVWNEVMCSFLFRVTPFGDYCMFGDCEIIGNEYDKSRQ